MNELKELLDRGIEGFEPVGDALDRTLRRAGRRQRNRRLGAAVLAVAVFGGTVVALWSTLRSPPQPASPAQPRLEVTAKIPLGNRGTDLIFAGGLVRASVLAPQGGVVVRVDPATNRVLSSSLPFGCDTEFQWLAAGDGAEWVANGVRGGSGIEATLWQTEPTTRPRALAISAQRTLAHGIAVGGGSVWVTVTSPDAGGSAVVRYRSGLAVPTQIGLPGSGRPVRLAAGEGAVWAVAPSAAGPAIVVFRIDQAPDRASMLARVPIQGLAEAGRRSVTGPVPLESPDWLNLAAGRGALWVSAATGEDRTAIVRIDVVTGEASRSATIPGIVRGLAVGEGAVWAVTDQATLWRIDARTGGTSGKPLRFGNLVQTGARIGSRVIGQSGPYRVAAGGGAVWVLANGLLLRVDQVGG